MTRIYKLPGIRVGSPKFKCDYGCALVVFRSAPSGIQSIDSNVFPECFVFNRRFVRNVQLAVGIDDVRMNELLYRRCTDALNERDISCYAWSILRVWSI